ncbi:response regulator [Gemmatimonas sp.]
MSSPIVSPPVAESSADIGSGSSLTEASTAAARLSRAVSRTRWYQLSLVAAAVGGALFVLAYRKFGAQYPFLVSIAMLLPLAGGLGPTLIAGWGALALAFAAHLLLDTPIDVTDRVRFVGTGVLIPALAWVAELRRRYRIEALQREVQLESASEHLREVNAQLESAFAEQRRRHDQLEELTTAAPGVMFQYAAWADGRHGFEFVSGNVREETALDPAALLRDAGLFWNQIEPDDRSAVRVQMHRSRELLVPWDQEFRVRDARFPDGRVRWVSLHARPRAVPEQRKIIWTGIITDTTERRLREEAFRQSQRLESVGVLAGGVAHDFNNLLTTVIGEVELIELRKSATPDIEHALGNIKYAALSGAALSRQLLGFAGRSFSTPRRCSASELLDTVAPLLRRLLREQIVLHMEVPDNVGWIHVDSIQFDQVMLNLTANARDAMGQGGALTIRARRLGRLDPRPTAYATLAPGELVEIVVSDTGPGMSESVRSRAFEPFFTTKTVGHGSGLGLSTCHGIVTQAGGTMQIDPPGDGGCTVRMAFPASPAPINQVPMRSESDHSPAPLPGGSETLLVVDDDHQVRRVTVEALRRRGYRVLKAANGADALRVAGASEFPIDLLVTDVVMPEMDGMTLADLLREQHLAHRVLFVSGYPMDSMREHHPSTGQIALLLKPYRVDELATRVRHCLDLPRTQMA